MDWGLFIIRVVIGLLFAAHGMQKLAGWFGGHGLKGTGGFFDSIGIKPGYAMALLAGLAELAGGLLFAFGLLTWVGAVLLIGTMLVSIFKVHGRNGLWATSNGYEYNLVLIVAALAVILIGPGEYALDALWLK
ncbi:DoxX family protein [Cohnella nanjingensis]|uniref:DoxX family protein n=1 Tax=Cohnella nanjingensis TaxID=1387779 RepID=A0A7X0VGA0_9BACL|nr:DoxX family protein [Cohnella nanjingensis]MBB6672892.1 DoxX family protein [Cohnella nanjingensis]